MKMLFTIIYLSIMTSCATQNFSKITLGMTSGEVKKHVGDPEDRTFESFYETWFYKGTCKEINFKHNKVVSLKNDSKCESNLSDQENKVHEIKIPEASATKININTTSHGPTPCVGRNIYGVYAKGGGCNIYGCWPKGGSCTIFGCSLTKNCSATKCPNKVNSYECKMPEKQAE